ncbi:MAG TPA: hypothetical protein VHO47_02020 [Candidatus Babeliales bacterium]|nr:hypothetical protein [Candidatus Babeliales bacterium]
MKRTPTFGLMGLAIISLIILISAVPKDYEWRRITSDGQYGFPPSQGINYTPNLTSNRSFNYTQPRGVESRVRPEYNPAQTTIYQPKLKTPEKVMHEVE